MEFIIRMKSELDELNKKISMLKSFLERETEAPKLTNAYQRELLASQKEAMETYSRVLDTRIKYEIEKVGGING